MRALLLCSSIFVFNVAAAAGVWAQDYFEEDPERVTFHTIWDFRYVRTGEPASWLDAELGKARYGGDGIDARHLFRVPQASFVFGTRLASRFTTHVQVNVDMEPENPEGRYGLDRVKLIEAFGDWRWAFAEPLEVRVKGGLFFPPISMEHVGEAWTTFYTVTPSAINAWVGEEIRATGLETSLAHVGIANELLLRGSAFWNNDPTGSLLAYRGWAIHDRQTGWRDRVPLPPTPSLEPGGIFSQQAPWVEPLVEVDGRVGYYVGAAWQNYEHFEVNGMFYDNRGVPDAFNETQYAWNTRFANLGGVWFLPGELEVLAQYMDGSTDMGFLVPGGFRVSAEFRSWYAMFTAPIGRTRATVRYEAFDVWDRDAFQDPDSSDETGSAWTFAYLVRVAGQHRIAFEVMRVDSDRPARASIGLPANADELVLQLSLRLAF